MRTYAREKSLNQINMTTLYKWLLGAVTLILIGIGFFIGRWVYYKPEQPNTNADYFKQKNFKPDTIIQTLHDTIHKLVPFETQLPPKVVIKYQDYQKPEADTIKPAWFYSKGNIIIDTTSAQYKYSGYDHLIYGEISKDTIRLDLQHGNDQPFTRLYLSNYSKYKYQIINNSMRLHEYSTTKSDNITQSKKFFRYDGTFINGGYELSGKNYSTGTQTGINLGNLRINGYLELPLNQPSTKPLYGVKVGYKLF